MSRTWISHLLSRIPMMKKSPTAGGLSAKMMGFTRPRQQLVDYLKWANKEGFNSIEEAQSTLKEMVSLRPLPNHIDFSMCLNGFARVKNRDSDLIDHDLIWAFNLLRRAHKRIDINGYVYNLVINSVCKTIGSRHGMACFGLMVKSGEGGDQSTYAILMKSLADSGNYREGIQMYQCTGLAHNVLDEYMKSSLLLLYFGIGRNDKAMDLISCSDCQPSVTNLALDHFLKTKNMAAACWVYDRIATTHLSHPNPITSTILLQGLLSISPQKPLTPRQILFAGSVLTLSLKRRVPIDIQMMNVAITIYCTADLVKKALLLFQALEYLGLQADTCTYNALIDGCSKNMSYHATALLLFSEMVNVAELMADNFTFNSVLKVSSNEERRVILGRMFRVEMLPDSFSHASLLHGKTSFKLATSLYQMLATLPDFKHNPHLHYRHISSLCKMGRVKEAEKLYRMMLLPLDLPKEEIQDIYSRIETAK